MTDKVTPHQDIAPTEGKRVTTQVVCGFCRGQGRDPFGVMSPISTCQVCGGAGQRTLTLPTAPCALCHGTGVYPGSRLTCTACGGIGMISTLDDAQSCPTCGGSGSARSGDWPDSPFPCSRCRGTGLVPATRAL